MKYRDARLLLEGDVVVRKIDKRSLTVSGIEAYGQFKTVKIICLDTVDQLVDIANTYTITISNNSSPKKVTSINEALGGFARGTDFSRKIIIAQLTHLENAGYGLVFIGHTKEKEKEDRDTGIKYDVLTGNMQDKFDDIFTNIADVYAIIVNKHKIEDVETKEVAKKVEKIGNLVGTERRWVFRDDAGSIVCGTRIANMPNDTEFTPKAYINAITDAILSEGNYSPEEAKAKRKIEVAEREKEATEYVTSEPILDNDGDKIDNLEYYKKSATEICKELDSKYRADLTTIITSCGVTKVALITDIDLAKKVYAKLDEFRNSVK